MPFIDLFTGLEGRIGRKAFWSGTTIVALVLWLVERGVGALALAHGREIVAFAGTFALYPFAALAAKRAADRNRPRLAGIALVVGTVLLALIGRAAAEGAATGIFGWLSMLCWIVSLVDLGLMPGARAQEPAAIQPGTLARLPQADTSAR